MQMGGGGARGGAKENFIQGLGQRHATAARRNLCKALQIFYLLVFLPEYVHEDKPAKVEAC